MLPGLLCTIILLPLTTPCHKDPTTDLIRVNCSSYYRYLHFDSSFQKNVSKLARSRCPEGQYFEVVSINFIRDECEFQYVYHPSKSELLKTPACADAIFFAEIFMAATVWGYQWGCPAVQLKFDVTPFYSTLITTKTVNNMGFEKYQQSVCDVPILTMNSVVDVKCALTGHGGYKWHVVNPELCTAAAFNNVGWNTLEALMVAPARCQLTIFVLLGILKQTDSKSDSAAAFTALDMLERMCSEMHPAEFEAARIELYQILDNIVHTMVDGNERPRSTGADLFRYIGLALNLLANYAQNYHGSLIEFYHRTLYFRVYQFTQGGPKKYPLGNITVVVKASTGATLIACSEVFRLRSQVIFKDRLDLGLCYVKCQEKTMSQTLVSVVFEAAWSKQPWRYACVWSLTKGGSPVFSYYPLTHTRDGRIACQIRGSGLISLVHLGSKDDDLRRIMWNVMNLSWLLGIQYVLIALLLSICACAIVIQISEELRKQYADKNLKPKAALCWLQVNTHLLLSSAMKLLLQTLVAKHDDGEGCKVLGPLQMAILLQFELVNLLRGWYLLVLRPSHQAFRTLVRLLTLCYLISFLPAFLSSMMASVSYYNLNCYPDAFRYLAVTPHIIINCVNILFCIGCFVLVKWSNWHEPTGVLITSLISATTWISMFHLENKHLEHAMNKHCVYVLSIVQAAFLLLWSVVQLRVFKFVRHLISHPDILRRMRRATLSQRDLRIRSIVLMEPSEDTYSSLDLDTEVHTEQEDPTTSESEKLEAKRSKGNSMPKKALSYHELFRFAGRSKARE